MGAYLDRLTAEFDQIKNGIDTLVDRAAAEDRDVTADEAKVVERDQARMSDLTTSIEHYTAIEEQSGKVAVLRAKVPTSAPARSSVKVTEPEYKIEREFPSPGHYAATLHRAWVHKDPEAIAAIERATAHQTTGDNPGLIPRPILGPVISDLTASRPFISSCTPRPLPAGQFDRPVITQHVEVGKQAAEKDPTASQKMLIGKLPVAASTYAGHLNISRQDVKWSSPNILSIVYEDFAVIYAQRTDADAAAQFAAATGFNTAPAVMDGAGLYDAIFGAAAEGITANGVSILPDTLYVSADVWGGLGGMLNPFGLPMFPSLTPESATGGNVMNLGVVVDGYFPAETMILGPRRYAEWYEDLDGLMQVGEPDVLGQLVGYAGYGAFLNTQPSKFTKFTLSFPAGAGATRTPAAKSSSK
jgi:HK97 family phage major capsid protein